VLLISAAPITVFMNSVRIAVAGIIAQHYGTEWLDGFTHFFEGWVIFASCVAILFLLAWVLLFLQPKKMGLTEALDLETDGLMDPGRPHPPCTTLRGHARSYWRCRWLAMLAPCEALPKRDTQGRSTATALCSFHAL
jgi:hypothetical protein